MVAGAAESQAPRASSSSSPPYLTVLATVVTPIQWKWHGALPSHPNTGATEAWGTGTHLRGGNS